MTIRDDGSAIIRALNHDLRREILRTIAGSSTTYTELMNHLDIQSGLLAYHLRGMKGLLEKGDDRTFRLTTSGQRAFYILEGNASLKPIKIVSKPFSLRPFLIFLVACSLIANIFLAGSVWEAHNLNGAPAEGIRAETELLVDDSLSIIYSIYDDWDTPKERLVELLIDLVEIRSNLQGLSSLTPLLWHTLALSRSSSLLL